jgi:hypothetical protein
MEIQIDYYEKYPMEIVDKRRRFCVEITTAETPTKLIKSVTRKTFEAVYEIAKKWNKKELEAGNEVTYGLGALALENEC